MRPGVLALAVVLATRGIGLAEAPSKPETAAEPAAAAAPAAPPAYVGDDEVCGACHEEQAKTYAGTRHATYAKEKAPAARGCEGCHGPGQAHVDAGGGKGVGGLQSFARAEPAAARSAPCLACHAGNHGLQDYRGSEHALAGVACTDCHTGHGVGEELLVKALPRLCYGCHLEVRGEFALTEHHKVDEGVVSCTDCHAPHGSRNFAMMRGANDRTCFKCHGDLEGPFVFEHVGLVSEGCRSCHQPHGSVNRHLLLRQQVAQLCYQCHTVTPTSHTQPNYRDCTRCHVSIHGSNTNAMFLQQ